MARKDYATSWTTAPIEGTVAQAQRRASASPSTQVSQRV